MTVAISQHALRAALHIINIDVKLALKTFISTFAYAVDNSTICTNKQTSVFWRFFPFGVVVQRLRGRFILQGKVATLIYSLGGLSLYC